MDGKLSGIANRPAAVAGVLLLAIAAVTFWDASQMTARATYGVGADATSYLVATLLVALGLSHLICAFHVKNEMEEKADWQAIGWIALALAGLIGFIACGGGFIAGSSVLFACTSRAFGRRAFLADLCIGVVLGVMIYLFFNELLTLALPQGPLEKLF